MSPGVWLRRSTSRARTKRKMTDDQGGSTPSNVVTPAKKKRPSSSELYSPQQILNIKRKRTQTDRYQPDVIDDSSRHSKTRTRKGADLAVRSKGNKKVASAKKADKKGSKESKKKEIKKRGRAKKEEKGKKGGRAKKEEKVKKGGRAKTGANSKLVPNSKIEVVKKDPTFEVKNETSMPEVSKTVQCKKAIRAVLTNDMPLLKKLIANTKEVPSMFIKRSVAVEENALYYAIKANKIQFVKVLLGEFKSEEERVSFPPQNLTKENTGSYDYISLGHAVRNINVSRGGREGNDAFLKDQYMTDMKENEIATTILEYGCNLTTLDLVMREIPRVKIYVNRCIHVAVRHGHRKLAGELIKRTNMSRGFGFNKLHEEVLLCDKPDELSQFRDASVKKKPWDNVRIMPLQCAAINPNPKILEKLLSRVPEINAADQRGRKIIHYAAACTGSGPLEYLLNRSAFADETDNQGKTPLMIAAELNRTRNIEVLAKKLKSEEGGVTRRNVSGYTPLHFAAMNGHNDSVRALIKHGANLQAMLSAGKDKLTPFMLACEHGHFQTVKLLAESGAIIDERDKLKRTPLVLAVMNGHYPVAAFLLRKGVDPNAKDSSGNTPLHYAAGYGWWFALKLLLSAGANPNTLNDWKVPPLAIAFMKGHVGCADLLLEEPGVDVNFRDADGWTIAMLTVGSLSKSMMDQLKYLVEKKKADVSLTDANDWNALHHLVANNINENPKEKEQQREISIEMATFLIAHGCDLLAKNSDGETPPDIAIKKPQYNAKLLKFLLEKGGRLTNFTNDQDENMLHLMAQRCISTDQTELFNIVVDNRQKLAAKDKSLSHGTAAATNPIDIVDVKKLAQAKDKVGFTPLQRWIEVYTTPKQATNKKKMEQGRAFLKCLLEKADSDVNVVVSKKDHPWDGSAVVHILAATAEKVGKCICTGVSSDHSALELILRSKPDLGTYDRNGRAPLHLAVKASRPKLVERLVNQGVDVTQPSKNSKDDQLATPLILAIQNGLFQLVDSLLTSTIVNTTNESDKVTPLHCAAMLGQGTVEVSVLHVVKKLLAKGANINAKDTHLRTPLHYACKSYISDKDPSTDLMKLLLGNKADVFACDKDGRLPLHYLFFNMDNVNDSSHIDPIEAVRVMSVAMKGQRIDKPDKLGRTPLHAAALRGAIISFMAIAEKVQDIDVEDSLGNTPLVMATMGKHVSVVIFLLEKGANIGVNVTRESTTTNDNNAKSKKEEEEEKEHFWQWKPLTDTLSKSVKQDSVETLFRTVVRNEWQGIMFLLMDRLERHHVPYITPIQAAIEEHQFQLALNLISSSRGSQRIDGVTSKKHTLLHILALSSAGQNTGREVQVCEKLMTEGVGFGYDKYGCTPLTYAILAEHLPLCKIFWGHLKKQDGTRALTRTDKKGRNLLAAALWRRPTSNQDIVSYLVDAGASLDMLLPLPLWQTEGKGAVEVPHRELEEWYHMTDHPVGKLSPLIAAIKIRQFKLVKFLLRKGADPNFAGTDTLTPLMHAVKENDITLVKVLLNFNYNPDKDDDKAGQQQDDSKVQTLGKFGAFNWSKQTRNTDNDGSEYDSEYDEDDDPMSGSDQEDDAGDMNEDDEEEENDMDKSEDNDEGNGDDNDKDMDEDDMDKSEDNDEGSGDDSDEEEQISTKTKPEKKKAVFKKTSSVDLSATDSHGRTAIHHMMSTCDYGTYQNVVMLELFASLKAPLNTEDNKGKTPLDYALKTGSSVMAEALHRLQGKKKPHMVLPSPVKTGWTDQCDWSGEPSIDFREDSKKLLEKVRQENEKNLEDLPKYPKPKVDPVSKSQVTGEVLMDTDQDIPYDVLMTKVDVKYGIYGFNNFYKMQIVFAKGKNMYVLLTRWGRIGTTGQYQHTPFGSKEDAVKEFCKIFKAKSGNAWSNVKQFTKLPKKYKLVQTDPYYDRRTVKKVEFNFKSDKASKLPEGTNSLLGTLTSVDMLKHGMKTSGASERLLPFGHLKGDVIAQGSKILNEIRSLLKQTKDLDKDPANPQMDKKQQIYDRMLDLSSEFYEVIPNDSFTYDAMQPLDNEGQLDNAQRKLADMSDLELTGNMMLAAQHRVSEINPLDYIYRSLDCEMEPMEENDVMSQLILKQIHHTSRPHQGIKVQRIYKLQRRGEDDSLTKCALHNHKLLWHGTKPFNVLSILKRGLLVAPMGAPFTGSLHGTGIYHADMIAKSIDYCSNYGSPCKSNFLFLSEVALGTIEEESATSVDKLKKGCNSLKCPGSWKPDPSEDLLLPIGAVLPVGSPENRKGWGSCSEFVVYKEAQVCLRYLVQIKA